jgi:nitrogen fixation/metabolism regulation signal transduction histidine kinase
MILLALSVVLAILISNWVTVPLRIIQDNFKLVSFGKQHEKINYDREDEIGALVRAYNVKLEELALAAEQLALNERESAWRDMAKQVAHEIKNPLTPMKLSVQHFLRSFDRNDPHVEDKLRKVVQSLIEQIDSLSSIANEFSNFAKMPMPEMEVIVLSEVVKNVLSVFEQEENCTFQFQVESECTVLADRDQMVRVFNNLIKNAIQAVPADREGNISVTFVYEQHQLIIHISDNGKGIPEEMQNKLFVPYFTTKSTGSGIGLAVVKQIIENHNGQIKFSSKPDVGTTFVLTLPQAEI